MNRQPNSQSKISLAAIALGVFTAFLWALWPVLSRYSILQNLKPLDITVLRFIVAGLVMLPYLVRRGFGGIGLQAILFLSLSAGALYVASGLSGLTYAPAAHGGMIIPSSTMLFAAIGGWLFFGDKPSALRLLGMTLIATGIILAASSASLSVEFDRLWVGHILFVFAGACWGSFTVATQRINLSALHIAAIVSVGAMIIVTPPYVIFVLVLGDGGFLNAPFQEIAFQALFQGLVIAILALYTYAKTIKLLGSAKGSLFVALVPGMAPLLAYLILAETPSYLDIVSLVIISVGMVVALRAK